MSVDCVKSDTAKLYWLTSSGSLEGAGINNVSMRGIAIQSAGGFINISGLDNNESLLYVKPPRHMATSMGKRTYIK
ncbi:MAG: hypothetical protein MR670_02985 [Prevotella sp.]|nr:hypothetical protein [Prevotella sp.]